MSRDTQDFLIAMYWLGAGLAGLLCIVAACGSLEQRDRHVRGDWLYRHRSRMALAWFAAAPFVAALWPVALAGILTRGLHGLIRDALGGDS